MLSEFEVALHEACHAVVAKVLGRRVVSMAVVPTDMQVPILGVTYGGSTDHEAIVPIAPPNFREVLAAVALAGHVGLEKYKGASFDINATGSIKDFADAMQACFFSEGTTVDIGLQRLQTSREMVKQILFDNTNWDKVIALANRLHERKVLNGHEIETLF